MSKRAEQVEIIETLAAIPAFRDEAAEAAFWATHRLSATLLDQMQPLDGDNAPPARASKSVTLRMDPALLARLQTLARQLQMPYQRLLKQLLQERLQQMEKGDEGVAEPGDAGVHTVLADAETVREAARTIGKLARDLETAAASLIRSDLSDTSV
jgi:predicted transcriptional regulator